MSGQGIHSKTSTFRSNSLEKVVNKSQIGSRVHCKPIFSRQNVLALCTFAHLSSAHVPAMTALIGGSTRWQHILIG